MMPLLSALELWDAALHTNCPKKGWKTLTIDKLAASGHGSTANTCAVIRVHYSTIDGTAAAYESYKYWENWAEYIGVQDPLGLAKLIKRGVMVMKSTANDQLRKSSA